MNNLTILLLGRPQFFVDGTEVTNFNTRKDQALLAYLAVTGTLHSRETLAGLLWSDLPEAKARRNLRHALSHLQKVIGPQWLTTERGVALTQDQSWSVDVQTLRSALKHLAPGATTKPTHNDTQTMSALDQVLQLYRGEFLQGFHIHEAAHFEEWVLAQREEVHLLTLRGLEALVERCLAQGAYAPGLAATRRLLQLEPWSEPAHCLQMQLLAQSGRRAEALAQYATCRQVLAAELGVAPMPTTTALYQQIQTGKYNWPGAHHHPASSMQPAVAPPTATASVTSKPTVPNNLLAPLAAFVGRQTELALIQQRLGTADCRLLTIVGPGGMGKTSLAHAAAQRLLHANQADFPDGIYFVALAGLEPERSTEKNEATDGGQTGTLIATTIAERIGCDLQSGLPPQVQLQNYLRGRRLLLILDNFEQLLAATETVLTLLTQAPTLTMLITSRARLNVRGETVLTLTKLSLPTAAALAAVQANRSQSSQADLWQTSDAIAMFVQRAQCLDLHFMLNATNLNPVMQICQLVDGLPLGIELATSMLPIFSCAELAKELAQSLAFLIAKTHDLPVDQRTLRAVFERSWRLLPPPEQMLLAKLAIFPATFDWEATQVIAEATRSLLLRLINQSLVNLMPDGRYSLHPLARTFALEKLEQTPAQVNAVRAGYAHFYLDFLAQNGPALKGPAPTTVIAQIYTELDNLRLAWRWAIIERLHSALLASMHTLFLFYDLQGLFAEAVEQAENALQPFLTDEAAQSQSDGPSLNLLIGRLQTYWAGFIIRFGRMAQADDGFSASLARLQQARDPFATVLCLSGWGSSLRGRDPQQAKVLSSEAARQVPANADGWLKAWVYVHDGEINHLLGNYIDAEAQYTQAYVVAKQTDCAWGLAHSQRLLGRLQVTLGHYQAAEAHLHDAIAYARQQNMKTIWIEAITHLGEALRLQGRFDEAQQWYGESRQQAEALQHKFLIAQAMWGQGSLAEQRGEYAAARDLFTESRAKGHPNLWAYLLPTPGWALIGLGELEEAQRYFAKVVTEPQTRQFPPIILDTQVGLAYIQWLRAHQSCQASQTWVEESERVLYDVYRHPAASAETRQRIIRIK